MRQSKNYDTANVLIPIDIALISVYVCLSLFGAFIVLKINRQRTNRSTFISRFYLGILLLFIFWSVGGVVLILKEALKFGKLILIK